MVMNKDDDDQTKVCRHLSFPNCEGSSRPSSVIIHCTADHWLAVALAAGAKLLQIILWSEEVRREVKGRRLPVQCRPPHCCLCLRRYRHFFFFFFFFVHITLLFSADTSSFVLLQMPFSLFQSFPFSVASHWLSATLFVCCYSGFCCPHLLMLVDSSQWQHLCNTFADVVSSISSKLYSVNGALVVQILWCPLVRNCEAKRLTDWG